MISSPSKGRVLGRWRAALRAGGHRRAIAVLGAFGAVAVLLTVATTAALGIALQVGTQNLRTAGGTVSTFGGDTVSYGGSMYERDPDVVAIALIGYDQRPDEVAAGRAGQADALMVLALNVKTGACRVIAIPRDSMVAVDQHLGDAYLGQKTEQICLAYSYGDGREKSCEYTLDALERVLSGVPFMYYLAVNMSGVGPITDAIGGIELAPLVTIPETNMIAGQTMTLRGYDAEWYLRWRDLSQLDSALQRQQRQKQYLQAFFARVQERMAALDVATLAGVYQATEPYLVSNMGAAELLAAGAAFAHGGAGAGDPIASGEKSGHMDVTSLPGEVRAEGDHAAYYLDQDGVRRIVLDTFYAEVDAED